MPGCCAPCEGLDDDHGAAAAGAGMLWLLRFLRVIFGQRLSLRTRIDGFNRLNWNYCRWFEQFAGAGDVLGTLAAGEHSIVTNAVEACGQHMDKEAADELGGRERHLLVSLGAFETIILPLEGDAVLVACDQAPVGDGESQRLQSSGSRFHRSCGEQEGRCSASIPTARRQHA